MVTTHNKNSCVVLLEKYSKFKITFSVYILVINVRQSHTAFNTNKNSNTVFVFNVCVCSLKIDFAIMKNTFNIIKSSTIKDICR
jgi:hypothetical protein